MILVTQREIIQIVMLKASIMCIEILFKWLFLQNEHRVAFPTSRKIRIVGLAISVMKALDMIIRKYQ